MKFGWETMIADKSCDVDIGCEALTLTDFGSHYKNLLSC